MHRLENATAVMKMRVGPRRALNSGLWHRQESQNVLKANKCKDF